MSSTSLTLNHLALEVSTHSDPLLSPITLNLHEKRIGLIGTNGSGKSTLLSILGTFYEPSDGFFSLTVHSESSGTTIYSSQKDLRIIRSLSGFLLSDGSAQILAPTVLEDVLLSVTKYTSDEQAHTIAQQYLHENRLEHLTERNVFTLSSGQKQQLALTSVIAARPQIIYMDEPTTMLDLKNKNRFQTILDGLDQQVICSTHDLDLATSFERVLVLDQGRLVYDGKALDAVQYYKKHFS